MLAIYKRALAIYAQYIYITLITLLICNKICFSIIIARARAFTAHHTSPRVYKRVRAQRTQKEKKNSRARKSAMSIIIFFSL